MDIKQLKAIVTVAEVGSVTRAAELLHLVQPAVTRQIRTLEQELGIDLFERTGQGMRPTDAGAIMVDRARRALNELERARAEVQPSPGVVTGIVSVGLLESTSDLLAEPLVTAVARDHPGVELRLMTAYSGHLQQWLDAGDLDLTLLYNLDSTPSLNARPLVREHLWAVAPASAGLRADRPVTFAEAARHPLVMPASGHALRRLIDAAAVRADAVMDVVVQTNSMRVQKQLVQAGHGWTVLPGVGIAEDVTRGTLSAAPLSEPDVWRSIVLGTPRHGRTPPAVEVVARELVRQVNSAVQQGRWPSAQVHGSGADTDTDTHAGTENT
ncbi:LysR substrate-binding domain-containing protein [Streptomyces niveiscabiei]|uniref:LysR family transcriptional regulator n=1 Tax=Streptomyces niveiscabiei TaxID=164115 RepID=UPI0029AD33CD|nr:LysR substrate-binding domain-containing protein [Streptomyces niveiscabiei]MDX3387980.1 LysR substrate-binding domain-containing protein [Streptomyces niveiscabiei]